MGKQVVVGLLMSLLCACSSGGSGTFCPPGQAKKGRC